MDKKVDLKKDKLDKFDFLSVFDSEFRELGIEEGKDMSFFDSDLASVDDLFGVYERLFLEIPKKGDLNSHEYLAKTSGEHAEYEKVNEEINELIEEINELRNENLTIYQNNIDLEIKINELIALLKSNNILIPEFEEEEEVVKYSISIDVDPPSIRKVIDIYGEGSYEVGENVVLSFLEKGDNIHKIWDKYDLLGWYIKRGLDYEEYPSDSDMKVNYTMSAQNVVFQIKFEPKIDPIQPI